MSGQLELTLGDTESLSVSTFEGEISLSASDGLPDNYATIMANSITSLVINGGSGDNFIDLQDVALDTFANLSEVSISGGDGADQIFGSEFSDAVFGGTGDDWNYAAQGDDSIWGEAGADSLFGGAGLDTLAAGDGDDLLNGQSGVDCVSGETGDDTVIGGGQADSLYGGDGEDSFGDFGGSSSTVEPDALATEASGTNWGPTEAYLMEYGAYYPTAESATNVPSGITTSSSNAFNDSAAAITSNSGIDGIVVFSPTSDSVSALVTTSNIEPTNAQPVSSSIVAPIGISVDALVRQFPIDLV